jgi:hypothetical protein
MSEECSVSASDTISGNVETSPSVNIVENKISRTEMKLMKFYASRRRVPDVRVTLAQSLWDLNIVHMILQGH